MILEKLIELLADYKDLDPKDITADTTLQEMEFDSLDIADVLMQIDDEFGVEIETSEQLETVGQVAQIIESRKDA